MGRTFNHPSRTALILIVVVLFLIYRLNYHGAEDQRTLLKAEHKVGVSSTTKGGKTAVSKPKSKERIAIITFTTDERSYTQLSLSNHDHYANLHGYDFIVEYEENAERGTMWHKYVMVENLINSKQYDWIWWMDFDTLITNMNVKVEDVIAESLKNATAKGQRADDVDWIVTEDCNNLNAGSFLARSTQRTLDFINAVRYFHDKNNGLNPEDPTGEDQLSEQDCMRDTITSDAWKKHILWIPQHYINAFPVEIQCWDDYNIGWEKGALAIHFAGAWAHVHEDDPTGLLMRKYADEIIWDDAHSQFAMRPETWRRNAKKGSWKRSFEA